MPGDRVELARGGGSVGVQARVRSITPIQKVLLLYNGEVVEEFSPTGERLAFDLDKSYPVQESGWFHLRAEGDPAERAPLDATYAQGFTNPIWVDVGGQTARDRASAEYSIRWIDKLRQMAEEWPGWRSEKEKQHVFSQFDEARAIYQGFLSGASDSND